MKKTIFLTAVIFLAASTFAAPASLTPAQRETDYTAAIEGRTAAILKVLSLSDTNKIASVHDAIIAQYRALRAWDDENDAKLKRATKVGDTDMVNEIHASKQKLHDQFVAALSANLTPHQVEQVKDKLTYNKVEFTFAGYCVEYPGLSEANKKEVLKLLKEAREEAMDGGSSGEKSAIFNRYKGKINNYLSKEGVHSKRWLAEHSQTNSATK